MITIDKLRELGADTDEGLARCYGNETLYLKLVNMICKEQSFDKLKEALDANDLDAAFEAAHALKGVLGNLSLTPMYQKSVEITDLLRARTPLDYSPLLSDLIRMRDELADACAS